MKFSIIVPVYKVEQYLDRCMDSILSQTFTDFECILVDDGSPDNCSALCDEYTQRDARIKVIHKQNGGLSSARNAGLEIAKGEYICFVDSDDAITPDFLQKIGSAFAETDADMVSFNFNMIWEDEARPARGTGFAAQTFTLSGEKERFDFICGTLLQYKIGHEACGRAFKRSILEREGLIFYNNKEIFAEDMEFTTAYSMHCNKIVVLPDELYFYFRRDSSIMGLKRRDPKVNEFVNLNFVLLQYIKSKAFTYFEQNYYVLFYFIMKNCYLQCGTSKRVAAIPGIVRKDFFEAYTQKVLQNREHINAFTAFTKSEYKHYKLLLRCLHSAPLADVYSRIYFPVTNFIKRAIRKSIKIFIKKPIGFVKKKLFS